MKPISKTIEFVRGDTYYISRYFKDKQKNPLNIDPETDDITFTMKQNVDASTVLIKKTLSDGGITIAEDGKVRITLNSRDTKDLEFGKYGYDIQITVGKDEVNPFVRTPESGKIKLLSKDFSANGGA